MKICYRCRRSDVLFSKNSKKSDGLQSWCKGCNKTASSRYYRDDKEAHARRVVATKKERAAQVFEYLSTQKCIDCSEADPVVLEFDHVRGRKDRDIGVMVHQGFSWERIQKEIAKCEIRCANCHRRKTMRERKQFRWLLQQKPPELGR